jgi:hypothetical protein
MSNKKEVFQYSLDMKFLAEYDSVEEASEKTGIDQNSIIRCCEGGVYNPEKYFFKYKNYEDKFCDNKFLIKNKFTYCKTEYTLIKRNKMNCVCHDGEKEVVLRYEDVPILVEKDTNDSNFAELYVFLSNYDIFEYDRDNHIIYNEKIKIYYNKLHLNSELFLKRRDIYNRYDENVINIFEDSWEEKKEIIKSRLLNKIFITPNKIYARKCEVKKLEHKEKRDFLLENHMQGDLRSKINYGLYYKDELVSVMTFGNLRKNLGQKSKEGSFELLRFSNKNYYNIIGGASKIFNHFLKEHNPKFILSYSDKAWGRGNLYETLGFEMINKTLIPNYFYIVDYKRRNRFGYRKDLLVSQGYDKNSTEHLIMQNRGLFRIYDCGSNRYEYNIDD